MHQTEAEWIKHYKQKGALWIHDGNPRRPHALLTKGKHSNRFFKSELIMEDPALLDRAVDDLLNLLRMHNLKLESVDRVVGPAMGAITLAHDLARQISWRANRTCLRAYVEKDESQGGKSMKFTRTSVSPGEKILPTEDVLTTGGSVEGMLLAITEAGADALPYVAVLVNRSGLKEVAGRKIISLIDQAMPMWNPEECPLCKEGSEAIRPKGVANWVRLNQT